MKKCKKNALKSRNGITLIALVITIIVLLILAGISISMLSGDNGILQKATDAKTLTGVGQEKDTIALAYNSALAKKVSNGNSSAVTDSELNTELDNSEATASGNPIIVTFTKSGNAYEIDSNGVIKPSTPKDPNTSNLTPTELAAIESNNTANPTDQIEEITSSVTNTNLKDTTKIKAVLTGDVPIPVGSTYKEGTVDTGVVIEYKGSQFVWVPIPVTATNLLYPKGTTKAMAKVSTDNSETTNYEGILYDFGSLNSPAYGPTTYTPYSTSQTMSNTYKREPDIVEDYDNNTKNYLSGIDLDQNTFAEEMQNNYNAMIEGVRKYGGFFVGRYETSIDSTTTVASKPGNPMTDETDNQMWYGMYDKQKKFTTNSDVMQSSMIWGSQYDAMLNWMQVGGRDINTTTNGNHSGTPTMTGGTNNTDIINNIYDLEGNLDEYTLEAAYTHGRAIRGGNFSRAFPASTRDVAYPDSKSGGGTSRLSLYIK